MRDPFDIGDNLALLSWFIVAILGLLAGQVVGCWGA